MEKQKRVLDWEQSVNVPDFLCALPHTPQVELKTTLFLSKSPYSHELSLQESPSLKFLDWNCFVVTE